MTATEEAPTGLRPSVRADLRAALPGWIAARVLVAVALGLAALARHLDLAVTHDDGSVAGRLGLFGWDASWYRGIAASGYGLRAPASLRFFPLYPLVGRVLGLGTKAGTAAALLVIANLGGLVLGAVVHRLVLELDGDVVRARRSALLVALAPPAFVLAMGYSEGLALTAVAVVLLTLHRGAWGQAALAGLVAGACRPTGVLIAVPVAIVALQGWRTAPWRSLAARALAVAAPAAGGVAYFAWCQAAYGDALAPLHQQSQGDLRGGTVDPFTNLVRSVTALVHPAQLGDGHRLWVLGAVVLAVAAFRLLPLHLAAFGAATLAVSLTAERLGSFERYQWGALVPVVTIVAVCGRTRFARILPFASGAAFLLYATAAFIGPYTP